MEKSGDDKIAAANHAVCSPLAYVQREGDITKCLEASGTFLETSTASASLLAAPRCFVFSPFAPLGDSMIPS